MGHMHEWGAMLYTERLVRTPLPQLQKSRNRLEASN
jgi:hypothetical protein